jgi:1-aminocyclopropane-1-carboxylate deaminase
MEKGMSCVFVSRGEFEDPTKIQSKWEQAGEYWIPMGGSGLLGIKGAATILNEVDLRPYSHIICATGTGTMAIGLATQILAHQVVWGLPVLKNWALAEEQKLRFLPVVQQKNLVWKNRDNLGRYGKAQPALLDFMNQWQAQTGIETDFIYTGKLFWAVDQMIKEEELEKGSKILVVHSGGLAGNRSLPQGSLRF